MQTVVSGYLLHVTCLVVVPGHSLCMLVEHFPVWMSLCALVAAFLGLAEQLICVVWLLHLGVALLCQVCCFGMADVGDIESVV